MKYVVLFFLSTISITSAAQTVTHAPDPWEAVSFLEGTWEATTGEGAAAKVVGTYRFQKELKGHVMARHSTTSGCAGPETFDCQHGDLLYIYQESKEEALKAIYFDNEGHVIHYSLSKPDESTVVFLSDPTPGPRFRLVYHLEGTVMSGKFQAQMPSQDSWRSYLEWSGGKQ